MSQMGVFFHTQNQVVYSTEQSRKAGVCVCWHLRNTVQFECWAGRAFGDFSEIECPARPLQAILPLCLVSSRPYSKNKRCMMLHDDSGLLVGSGRVHSPKCIQCTRLVDDCHHLNDNCSPFRVIPRLLTSQWPLPSTYVYV